MIKQIQHNLHSNNLKEDFSDFFHNSLCGFLIASTDGRIELVNKTMATWIGLPIDKIEGKKFSDFLSIGGKIFYETHLSPLLRMQGFFDEVLLEVQGENAEKIPVIVNALERKDESGQPLFVRITVFKAKDRRMYEQNLKLEKQALQKSLDSALELSVIKEQLIAILGHDLRNPLGSMIAGVSLLSRSDTTDTDKRIIEIIRKSAARMSELVTNMMDFARTRLGGGLVLEKASLLMEPVLTHVVDELKAVWPDRVISTEIELPKEIICDQARIAQLLSNLISNAIIHGSSKDPVRIYANQEKGRFSIIVCNAGNPILPENQARLFEPFTRESSHRSQNGLGLGLYIAQQIANAHDGNLTVKSDEKETCFSFSMPLSPPL